MIMENISEYYYNLLSDTTSPGKVLLQMYKSIFEVETNKSHVILFNKLVKVYGRFNVFFALLSLTEWTNVVHDTRVLYPALSSIIKKRYEKRHDAVNRDSGEDMTSYIKRMEKKVKETKKSDLDLELEDEQ